MLNGICSRGKVRKQMSERSTKRPFIGTKQIRDANKSRAPLRDLRNAAAAKAFIKLVPDTFPISIGIVLFSFRPLPNPNNDVSVQVHPDFVIYRFTLRGNADSNNFISSQIDQKVGNLQEFPIRINYN